MRVKNSQHGPVGLRQRGYGCAVLLFCLGATQFIVGCAARARPVSTWRGAGLAHPIMPATVAPAPRPPSDVSVDPVPELRVELPPPPPLLAVEAVPVRPRVAPVRPPESTLSSKPEPPVIAPQMSPEEINTVRQQMTTSISIAENNLARSQGKTLNTTQSNLASKIKGFITDARTAEHDGDLPRARSLATKAQVLSEELASSL
jgi:hypothetical protein